MSKFPYLLPIMNPSSFC